MAGFDAGDEVSVLDWDFTTHPGAVKALKAAGFSEEQMMGVSDEPSAPAVIVWLQKFNDVANTEARNQREKSNVMFNGLKAVDDMAWEAARARDKAAANPDERQCEHPPCTETLPKDSKARFCKAHRTEKSRQTPDVPEDAQAQGEEAAARAELLGDVDVHTPAAAIAAMTKIAEQDADLARRMHEKLTKAMAELLGGHPSEEFIRALPWRVRASFQAHIQKELADPTRGTAATKV